MHRTDIFALVIVAVHTMILHVETSDTRFGGSTIIAVDYEKFGASRGDRHTRSLRPCRSSPNHSIHSLKSAEDIIDVRQDSRTSDANDDQSRKAEKASTIDSNEREKRILTGRREGILADKRFRSKKGTGRDSIGELTRRDSSDDDALPRNIFKLSNDGERVDFQVHGHEGPKTYVFGFDTGNGKNRQYRLEERHRDGTVRGEYGYYDAKGKLRIVKYVAAPSGGYQERHHERRGTGD